MARQRKGGAAQRGNSTNYADKALELWQKGEGLPNVRNVVEQRIDVMERYNDVGAYGMLLDAAFDIETVTALFLENVVNAAILCQDERLTHFVSIYRRLRAEATRHWNLLAQDERSTTTVDYEEVLAERKRRENGR